MVIQREAVIRTVRRLRESPSAKEDVIAAEQRIAANDPVLNTFVEMFHFDADREASLERYVSSEFAASVLATIRHHFGDRKDMAICEVGAGNGFLAVALVRAGYTNVDMLEPSTQHVTGTGFLTSTPEFSNISVYSDLDAWYESDKLYDLIITQACIHHFDNPAVVATQIRLKVNDGASWLAFMEFFASNYEDTLSQLNNHRHAVLYGLYEWPYSAGLYSAMLAAGGFDRRAIAPMVPYNSQKLGPRGIAVRAAWRLVCAAGISWRVFALWQWLVTRSPKGMRRADASYMAFTARPIRWDDVEEGYQASGDAQKAALLKAIPRSL